MQVLMASGDQLDVKPDVAFGRPCSPQGLFHETAFQDLSPVAKIVAVYCIQGSQASELGIQKFNIAEAAGVLKLTYDQVDLALDDVVQAFHWRWDLSTGVLWMTDFHRRVKRWTPAALRRGLVKTAALPNSPVLDSFYLHGVPPHQDLEPVWQSITSPWRGPAPSPSESPPDPPSDSPAEPSSTDSTPTDPSSSDSPADPSPANSNPFKPSGPTSMRAQLEWKQHAASQSPSKYPPPSNRRHSHAKPRNKGKRKRGQ